MNRKQFTLALVEQSTKRLTVSLAEEMVKQFDSYRQRPSGDYYQNEIPQVLAWADRFALHVDEDEDQVSAIWEADDPDVVVASMDLKRSICPLVEAIRIRLFGVAKPKWTSATYVDAIAWIRASEKRAQKKITKRQDRRLRELREQHQKLAREVAEIHGIALPGFTLSFEYLEWVEPDGGLSRARARADSDLGYLADQVRRIADFTGLTRSDLLAHILIGSELRRDPAKFEIIKKVFFHEGEAMAEKVARVTFRGPSISSKHMGQIRKWIKEQWDADGRKAIADKDREIMEAVERRGGVPARGVNNFWSVIATELGYETRQGPYKRWKRLQAKLEARRIVGEVSPVSNQA